jgi:L-fucose isomerase-like protein
MNANKEKEIKVLPVFLLGAFPSFIREDGLGFKELNDEAEQDAKTDEILKLLELKTEGKVLVRKEEDLFRLNTRADALILLPHCMDRFPYLISLAASGVPIIISGEEELSGDALDTYEYLADYDNITLALNFDEIKQRIRIIKTVKQIKRTKVCVFDSGERTLDGIGWYKNPLLRGKFKTHYVDMQDFEKRYKEVDQSKSESLAKQWMDESEVREPTLEDAIKSAQVYIAMKSIIENMEADAAYVLWCGQFNKMLGTKMCFAITKLNDDGIPTGCWRGESLLPMLILHNLSEKPVFFGEVHTYKEGIISLRHCAVPSKISSSPLVLRRWRDRKGTVTGYCEMPKGDVTLVNSGTGDKIVVIKGDVVKCGDVGGDNCRTTVWVEVKDEYLVHQIVGREFAMVYGDYVEEAKEVGKMI